MRGGEHSNPRIEEMERVVAQRALNLYMSNIFYQEKGLKWTYNLTHFRTFYCTRNPELIKYLYEVKPFPEYFELEVTTCCDMKCKLCEHTHWKVKPQMMSFEQFKYVVNQFPNLKWVGMTGIGQSLLNKDYMKMMKYVKDRDIFIENFDNFKHITPEISRQMIDMGLDKLYASIDAATKETFEKMQPGADWDQVMENIKYFDRYKKSKRKHFPELWFHFIVTKDNIDEMEDYLQMIHDLDVDVTNVQFTKMLHPYKEVEHTHVEITREKKESVLRKAQELRMNASFNMNTANEEDRAPISTCTVWPQPFIFADGTVIACCSMNEQNDRPWQIKTSLGNIFKDGMRKIWKNYAIMLDKLKNGEVPENCERCVLYRK